MFSRIDSSSMRGPPRAPTDAYAVIETHREFIPVYAWMGERVARQLRRLWAPRWITFRDVTGAEYTMRAKDIRAVSTSSPKTRAMARAFHRARQREQDEDTSCE